MTLSRKNRRRIKVNDIDYFWVVCPDDEPGLGIVVKYAKLSGQTMVTWVEHGNIISPWLVRKAIIHALAKGWQPQNKGSELVFRFEGILIKDA